MTDIRRKLLKILTVISVFFLTSVMFFSAIPPIDTNAAELIIVLDPGHGGGDPGAVNTVDGVTYREMTLNLKIAQAAKSYLEQFSGVKVYMTRESDSTELTLAQRVSYANRVGAHALISIHNNSYSDGSAEGTLVLVADSDYRPAVTQATKDIGGKILDRLVSLGLKNRGLVTKIANSGSYVVYYPDGSPQDYYGIIQRSIRAGIPGIIIETAFISSPNDVRNYLNTDSKLEELGTAVGKGIADYYGLSADSMYSTAARTPIDAKSLTFGSTAYNELVYPLGSSKRTEGDSCVVISADNNAPAAIIDYMGMSLNAKENMCAVVTCKASDEGAKLSVFCGSDEIVTANDSYCLSGTVSAEYQHYLLDFSKLPGWSMGVNLLQFAVNGSDSLSIKSIEFFSGTSSVPYSDTIALSKGNTAATAKPTQAPTATPVVTAKPTQAPTENPTSVPVLTATPDATAVNAAPVPTPDAAETENSATAEESATTIAPGDETAAINTTDGTKSNNTKLIVVSTIAVLLVIAIAVYLVYSAMNLKK